MFEQPWFMAPDNLMVPELTLDHGCKFIQNIHMDALKNHIIFLTAKEQFNEGLSGLSVGLCVCHF